MKHCLLLKKQLNNDFIKNLLIKRQAWLVGFLFYRELAIKVEVEIRIETIISYDKKYRLKNKEHKKTTPNRSCFRITVYK